MNLFTETCTIRNPGEELPDEFDDYGNAKVGPEQTHPDQPCWYEPRGSGEDTVAKDQQIDGYWVGFPLGTPITAASVVVLDGNDYDVVGEPGKQPSGFIVPGFIKAAVERVRG